ncbi:MAG: hypothetical protein PHP50_09510 [Lachnospiraceae bacterium]|nr:hypothetical protein [Lachnospiraceae bacterium]
MKNKNWKTLIIVLFIIGVLSVILLTNWAILQLNTNTEIIVETKEVHYELPELTAPQNTYASLSVPTCFTRINGWYFLVDCYHNQILVNDNVEEPIANWHVMTSDMQAGHTIAGDGRVYLADDTENNRVLVFTEENGTFTESQVFEQVGNRPHFVVYDKELELFYVWSSMSGEMYRYRREADSDQVVLDSILTLPELNGVYVRSFTIIDDDIYLPTADGRIFVTDKNTLAVKETWQVPAEIAGMVQIMKEGNYFYLTVSTDVNGNQDYATIIRTRSLKKLSQGKYTDIYSHFVGGGTPYYMGQVDGRFYLTEHRLTDHALWSFHIKRDKLTDVEAVY